MYYINGDYVSDESATIAITDLGILRGYGVFDYLRTYGGKPFHLQDHLERLAYSAMTLGFTLSLPLHQIAEIISTLLQKNNYLESAIKIIATGGISPDQFLPSGPSSLMVLVYPLKTFPEISYIDGISVATTSLQRSFPWAKTLHYAPAIVALQQGKSIHAEEILYLNHRKEFLEAATSNLFVVKERKLLTTPETADILIGITRNLVLRLMDPYLEIEQRMISLDELMECDELFITSSTREVMPVAKVNGIPVSHAVGPITKQIMQHFSYYTAQEEWPSLKIPRYQEALGSVDRKDHDVESLSHPSFVV